MRIYSALCLVCCALFAASAARAAEPRATRPKVVNDMSIDELRDEVRRLSKDDTPYVKYYRAAFAAAEETWPKLKPAEQSAFTVHVYWNLVDSLRLMTGNYVLRAPLGDQPFDARYAAMMELSAALEKLKLDEQRKAFYAEVFKSDTFRKSVSLCREAVIDLWQRYEKAGQAVPYTALMALNQPGMGHSSARSWTYELQVGDLYKGAGEHATAAEWYAKVPPEGLGPLKAADELFAAGKSEDAEVQYRGVLMQLNDWAARQPKLRDSALAEPLEMVNLRDVQKHVEQRLTEIDKRKGK